MTDRELLELAAKAAGYQIDGPASKYMVQGYTFDSLLRLNEQGGHSVWNPLTDDGDALRLVVKFRMMIDFITAPNSWMVGCTVAASSAGNFYEKGFTAEATRRAIVRAAAEIGKGKP